jgi:hypothetical protein
MGSWVTSQTLPPKPGFGLEQRGMLITRGHVEKTSTDAWQVPIRLILFYVKSDLVKQLQCPDKNHSLDVFFMNCAHFFQRPFSLN